MSPGSLPRSLTDGSVGPDLDLDNRDRLWKALEFHRPQRGERMTTARGDGYRLAAGAHLAMCAEGAAASTTLREREALGTAQALLRQRAAAPTALRAIAPATTQAL